MDGRKDRDELTEAQTRDNNIPWLVQKFNLGRDTTRHTGRAVYPNFVRVVTSIGCSTGLFCGELGRHAY